MEIQLRVIRNIDVFMRAFSILLSWLGENSQSEGGVIKSLSYDSGCILIDVEFN